MECPKCKVSIDFIRVMTNIKECPNKRYFICCECHTVFTGLKRLNPMAINYSITICDFCTTQLAETLGTMDLVLIYYYPTVKQFVEQDFPLEKKNGPS
ncbi:hypothetical protein COT97_05850 [Candidatus Falkowbacteria bacterium CG10_big_fil_rev_8_21_14_0_10_39_11]|uniref:Uncharacterized protein n=1 Tax=Candidatus Falkowbacteria bacterium CG10_big_fil_rev_8_21_14_0_10_39_11 TaxID=1974565 RepID=A0A2H0V3D8_9BACT|nr:MAG: hypothetical protein COT97_05850 [Candidatus Falkowbacteria bacterium CG10_big_fil_rev_8_21_14_0_10_39_11]